jgi:uncharacterized protein (TIGR02246 family)
MRKSFLQISIFSLILMLCFTFGCQQPVEEVAEEAVAGIAALSDEDVAAIKASTEEYIQAWGSADSVTLAALYTEDGIMMPPNQSIVQGRDEIQASNEASPAPLEVNLTIVEIDGRGDIAYVRGTYSFAMQPEGVPEPIQDTGKYIEIRRKQEDGSWLITIDIWNSDMPLPE